MALGWIAGGDRIGSSVERRVKPGWSIRLGPWVKGKHHGYLAISHAQVSGAGNLQSQDLATIRLVAWRWERSRAGR
jgi:hypothetical protein